MKELTVAWVIFSVVGLGLGSSEDVFTCTPVSDFRVKNLHQTRCHLNCVANALKALHSDGERKLSFNEELYTRVSSILDDMEGRKDESLKYLGVVGSMMRSEGEKLSKLISYGSDMVNIVATVGGMLTIFNRSVRAVRETVPDLLVKTGEYYTAVEEIVRTTWSDLGTLKAAKSDECETKVSGEITELRGTCENYECPLQNGVSTSALHGYTKDCLEIVTYVCRVNTTLNLPRHNLYQNGAIKKLNGTIEWLGSGEKFHVKLNVVEIFEPLLPVGAAGRSLSVLQDMMANVTSLLLEFNEIHDNFTSLLLSASISHALVADTP